MVVSKGCHYTYNITNALNSFIFIKYVCLKYTMRELIMESFAEKHRGTLLEVTSNIFIMGVILLLLHHFTNIIVSFWIDIALLVTVTFASGFGWFFVYIQKDEEYFKAKAEPYFRNLFLAGLFVITIGSLTFDFIESNQLLNSVISNIFSVQFYLVLGTIGFGFFTFYFNWEKIEAETALETESERKAEGKREEEFDRKFVFLSSLDLDYAISEKWNKRNYSTLALRVFITPFVWIARLPYSSIKWMYKEGWVYSAVLILIFSLFFITRLYENNFINGSDNYNVLGIKNMYENGVSFYKYSPITDFFMLQIVKMFGFSLFTIKIPFITYSFITLVFICLIGRLLSKNLALMSSFLYVISPWAIIQSRITRDYSFDLMVGSIALFLCFVIYKRLINTTNTKDYVKYFILFSLIPLTIILLHEVNRPQTLITGIYTLLPSIFIIAYLLKRRSNNKLYSNLIYYMIISLIIITALYNIERFPFVFGFNTPNYIFFDVFFNPMISSPWQWYHNTNVETIFILTLFLLGVFSFGVNKLNKKYILILFSTFIFGLLLYTLKYESHLDYIPVRYIYFLFAPYVIILANAILNLFKAFKTKFEKLTIIILLIALINPTALIYSINPPLAYEEKGISNVQIDNIGVGRFKMLEVVNYLENELNVNDDTIVVFDGRYGELILYLNRSMDMEKGLIRSRGHHYDVSKNTYVQSNYFEYYGLKEAVADNPQGLYISTEKVVFNENEEVVTKLYNEDFYLYNTSFNFNTYINGYRIYSWNVNNK
ncbi:hypothetical protein Mpsy_2519 [Methanolobus psychrophilus R15]|nr:hypothetical protein Mpsy_2519 [Methanolobus psychrophilus R15]